jgi:uncharacterized membrane protein YGL010W
MASQTKIIPKFYGYFLIVIGLLLNNVDALPILLKRDDNLAEKRQDAIQKIVGALAIASGFCICFFGHQFYDKIIFFIGFAAGVFITKSVLQSVWGDVNAIFFYITACVVGLIVGGICICLYKVSLCILGVLAGYGFAAIILTFFPRICSPILLTIILVVIFVILIFVWEKPIIIIATGIAGSYLLFYGIDTMIDTGFARALQTMYDSKSFQLFESSLSVRAMVIASLVVAVLGWVVQFISYNNNKSDF